jgi:hypothetical protein
MSSLQQALQDVGYSPTLSRTLAAITKANIILNDVPYDTLRALAEEAVANMAKPRKVLFQRAGGLVLARYEGERTYVFGRTNREAASRLKTWAGEP